MKSNRIIITFLCGVLLSVALAFQLPSSAKTIQGPYNLVAWDSGTYVQLNWDADLGANTQGYNVYRSARGPDSLEKLNEAIFPSTTFIDYSAPRSQLVFYRVNYVNEKGEEIPSASVVGISTSSAPDTLALPEAALAYDKNNIITDSQVTNAGTLSVAQIQSFLSSHGSVLANFSTGGKTPAQHIYDNCQTHDISPYVVLVTLQKEKGLIRSSTANPNSFAMGWNTGDSSTSDFANQIYYGTRQFRLYYNNLGNYGWTVGQSHAVSDGTVTAANAATAGLYSYTPWIGQGGGGQPAVGGNYLFWDLWYNTFGFGSRLTATSVSDGFDYPVGKPDGIGWLNNHNGLGFLDRYDYGGTCGLTYHPGNDFNKDGTTGDQDRYEPVYAASNGTVIDSAYYGTSTWGNVILIEHILPDGSKVWSQYGHLENRLVQTGAVVARGDQIGRVGKGDGSLSAHLHFEIRKVLMAASAFPCGQSQTYVTDRYFDPIAYLNSHRSLSQCNAGTSTLRNRDGGPPIHPPGSVIKVASDPTVYLIDSDNRKRAITSGSVLAQLYNQSTDARTSTNFSSWVSTVAQDELNLYEQGGNISAAQSGNGKPFPDGKLISYNGQVSIVTGGGKRRPFATETTFLGLGFNFCQVVNLSQTEYNSYPEGPWVDAMPLLTSSVNLAPSGPYTVGQNITGSFTIKNVGYQSIAFSTLGIGGRFNGSTVYDLGFVSTTLAAGSSYPFGSPPRQLTSVGTYDFFAAYQEGNGHWALSVPAASGVIRSRQITVGTGTPTPTPTPTPGATPSNNNFANALLLTGTLGTVTGTNVNATKETGEPNHAGNAGGASVWYRWQAPGTGSVTFATTGSNFDTLLAAYTGAGVSSLTFVVSNDDFNGTLQSAVTFNAQSGGVYYFAVDGFGGATGSIVLGWGQIPPAPTANAATNVSSSAFTANWSSSTGAAGYLLDVSTSNTFSSFVTGYNNLDVGNVLSRSVTGLSTNTTYYYRARAYNSAGTSSNSNVISVATTTPPPAPTANAATNVTSSSFTANWSNSTGATGYRLDVSFTSNFSSYVSGYQNLDVGNVLSRSVTGLTAGINYYYRARAYNSAGTSGNSNTINLTTAVSPPPAPTANSATGVTSSSFTANWSSSSGATGYRVDVSTSSSFGSFVSGYQNLDVGNVLSRSVTGLSASTPYFYRVRAYNGGGTSGNSNTISLTTSGNPPPTRTLTVASSNPSSGVSVTVSPNDNNGQGNGTTQFTRVYNNNTNMSLTAPSTAGSNAFQKWQVDGVDLTTSLLANFVMDANHTITAVYVTGPGGGNAVYDATLRAPKCGQTGSSCDSGALLDGRDSLSSGPEPNQPNTINNSCADGAAGTYHADESVDRIRVLTLDGSNFAAGKTVRIEVTVWAWDDPNQDHLDLYSAPNANSPNWTYFATLQPTVDGSQMLSTTYTLPSGSLQAVRGVFRYQGAASSCGTNSSYDDYDDLIFAVGSATSTNVALAANGGIASASSTTPPDGTGTFLPSVTIDGDRKGLNTSFWRDGTGDSYPDWLQVDFAGNKTINEIDVYTLQDNYTSPTEPTAGMTFNLYGITGFDVQYWNGASWVTVPGGNVTGNNNVWRKFTFADITTSKVRVLVNNALASRSRVVELEAYGLTSFPPPTVNVALAANGGVASASSTTPPDGTGTFFPSVAIDGDRKGLNTSFWRDGTGDSYPDWLQVDFAGNKTINEIDVYTLQDNYTSPTEPTAGMTFNLYGITGFDVQYWNGASWVTVPGGNVTGNNNVWRKFTFTDITTSKVRVLVNNALASRSRIVELEAYSPRVNFALAANGAVASASSTTPPDGTGTFFPSVAIDGDRKGLNTSFWRDGTGDSYPDWLQVDFAGNKTINEIDVYTLQDNYTSPTEPTAGMTFNLYGITGFDVQYWNGASWVTVPGGNVTGNNNVWRKFTFTDITTSKVRVLVNNALASRSRVVELEAF